MLRMACIALALASLSACACVGRPAALNAGAVANFDATADAAPVQDVAALAVLTLDRRRFGLPSERQPDLRMIFVTTSDRKHRRARRKRATRARR